MDMDLLVRLICVLMIFRLYKIKDYFITLALPVRGSVNELDIAITHLCYLLPELVAYNILVLSLQEHCVYSKFGLQIGS